MSELSTQPIETANLKSSIELRGHIAHVVFRGTADQEAVPYFTTFFGHLQTDVEEVGIKEVVFDFRELEFLSASCFKRFAWWLEEVLSSGSPERVRFLSNSVYLWQRFSLDALAAFGEGRVTVAEVE